jgi:hypothetical protein
MLLQVALQVPSFAQLKHCGKRGVVNLRAQQMQHMQLTSSSLMNSTADAILKKLHTHRDPWSKHKAAIVCLQTVG